MSARLSAVPGDLHVPPGTATIRTPAARRLDAFDQAQTTTV
jgi:hypothetical protein